MTEPRTEGQRKKTWAIIDELVKQRVVWDGNEYTIYGWELIFTGLVRHQQLVENPNEKGSKIVLGCREKELTKEESSKMLLLIDVFCSENGIELPEQVNEMVAF